MINNIKKELINGAMDSIIANITKGDKNDLVIKNKDISYQITSSDNQKNNVYNNISSIILGECENILKKKYKINENLSLLIFKIDYFKPNSLIPIIGYEIFHPLTKEKLDLNICKNQLVNFNIPVSIDENNLFKYDPNNEYYIDECYPYTTESGTDILINDRQDEYNNNNMSICENNCTFKGYESETKKSICECGIKSKQIVISEIIEQNDILYNNFTKKGESSTMVSMKCYYTLFTKEGIYKNIGSYILIIINISFIISGILFYKFGYHFLEEDINKILYKKSQENNINNNKINETTSIEQKKIKKIKKKKINKKKPSSPPKQKNNNSLKKKKKKRINKIKEDGPINLKELSNNSNLKSFTKLDIKNNNNLIYHNNNKKIQYYKNLNDFNNDFTDYELNTFSYENALKYDKRTYFKYYISLIRTKHPLIFSFCPLKDYNSTIIKIDLFFLSFSIYYYSNALFFNEATIHKIYEDKGKYNFIYLIPYIAFAFLIAHTLCIILKYFSLSEKNICEIKREKKYEDAIERKDKVKRCIIIKYICFFVIGIIFLLFLWYYLSSFGAVYQNTQFYLIKNTLICFCFALIYPFFINLFPGIFRIYSLKQSNRSYAYITSIIIQFI